jgi:hypothetical protein
MIVTDHTGNPVERTQEQGFFSSLVMAQSLQ